MTLVVIFNVVLSVLILGATVAQLARSIGDEHRSEAASGAPGRNSSRAPGRNWLRRARGSRGEQSAGPVSGSPPPA